MSEIRFKIVEDDVNGGHTEKFLSLTELLTIISGSQVSPEEVGYLDGVTSPIQAQLDGKVDAYASAGGTLSFTTGNAEINLAHANTWTGIQTFPRTVVTPAALTGAAGVSALTITGAAHTNCSSAEVPDVSFNLARSVSFQAGTIANQRAVYYQAPTYEDYFGSIVQMTNAATVAISGPPIANGVSITNPYALLVESGVARFNGGLHLGSNQSISNSGTLTFANTWSFTGSGSHGGTSTYTNAATQPCIRIIPSAATNLTQEVIEVRANGGSTNLFSVQRNGVVKTRVNTVPADGELNNGEAAYWFDSTNGSAKFMIKAKQADGTVVTGNIALA